MNQKQIGALVKKAAAKGAAVVNPELLSNMALDAVMRNETGAIFSLKACKECDLPYPPDLLKKVMDYYKEAGPVDVYEQARKDTIQLLMDWQADGKKKMGMRSPEAKPEQTAFVEAPRTQMQPGKVQQNSI